MQGVATVFIANVYGVELGLSGYLTVILMSVLASIGTAGVPGVGLIMLSMVFVQVGLPIEGIGLILGVDRLLDMIRTSVNVTGDAVVTCVVAKSEKELDGRRGACRSYSQDRGSLNPYYAIEIAKLAQVIASRAFTRNHRLTFGLNSNFLQTP
jgi:Na+/H+-dicarboxylate symporter